MTKVLSWVGLVLGPLITLGSLAADVFQIMTLGLSTGSWVIIGLAIFFIAAISLFIGYENERRFPKKPSLHGQTAGIEFFPTMDELRIRHPLSETFKPGNEIHAYFCQARECLKSIVNTSNV